MPVDSNSNPLTNNEQVAENDNPDNPPKKEIPLSDVLLKPLDKAIDRF